MREHPIPFNADMVRAILAGAKTQTRRPLKHQPPEETNFVDMLSGGDGKTFYAWGPECDRLPNAPTWSCPLGQPGDRLWVREPGRVVNISQTEEESVYFTVEYLADKARRGFHLPERFDPQETNVWPSWVKEGRGIPNGIFREAARIHLEIVNVRVERLEDITIADAQAEGFAGHGAIIPFIQSWERIYGHRGLGCDAKPWLWVIEFKRTEAHNG